MLCEKVHCLWFIMIGNIFRKGLIWIKKIILIFFFILIFCFWYSTEIIFNTTLKFVLGIRIDMLNNMANWLVFALLMVQIIFMQSYKKKELMLIILITLPVIISTGLSSNRSLLSVWMFIVGAKKISFDKIIQIAYRILLIMVPMVIFLWLVGIIDDYTIMRGNIQRFSLGFSHPNQLGLRVFQLTLCYCYINRTKLSILSYYKIFFAILFTIIVPNSQTAYISLTVFLIAILIYKYMESHKKKFMEIFANSLAVCTLLLNILSIALAYIDVNNNTFLSRIDKWMGARFSWCHRVWQIYGVSFLGQSVYVLEEEIKLVGIKNRLWLDNAYVSILLRYGILVYLVTSIAYLCLIRSMTNRKEYVLAIILFLYSLYGLMENGLYMLSHNIFLIALSELLYHKTRVDTVLDETGN